MKSEYQQTKNTNNKKCFEWLNLVKANGCCGWYKAIIWSSRETQFKLQFTVSFMLPTSSSSWKTCMKEKQKYDVITVNSEVNLLLWPHNIVTWHSSTDDKVVMPYLATRGRGGLPDAPRLLQGCLLCGLPSPAAGLGHLKEFTKTGDTS